MLTESQKKSAKKYAEKNKERIKYIWMKNSLYSFIQAQDESRAERVTMQWQKPEIYLRDLLEIKAMLTEKLAELEQQGKEEK